MILSYLLKMTALLPFVSAEHYPDMMCLNNAMFPGSMRTNLTIKECAEWAQTTDDCELHGSLFMYSSTSPKEGCYCCTEDSDSFLYSESWNIYDASSVTCLDIAWNDSRGYSCVDYENSGNCSEFDPNVTI